MGKIRSVGNLSVAPLVLKGVARRAVREPRSLRRQLVKEIAVAFKSYGSPSVIPIKIADIVGIKDVLVTGGVTRAANGPQYDALVIAALCRLLTCRTVFEFGTYHGETAWLIAHNNPDVVVYTLDLPEPTSTVNTTLELTDRIYFKTWKRGIRFRGTPEAARIVQLHGDSATFDFAPYRERIDLVFIDASHSYSYVKSDTEAGLSMLSDRGTIVWDDYTYYPGFRWLMLRGLPGADELDDNCDESHSSVRGSDDVVATRSHWSCARRDRSGCAGCLP
jgi:hypothetical protein